MRAYHVSDTSDIITPALLVFRELLEDNIDRMIQMAGDASRLRPHAKTHKMREVARLELARGITKHKCATFAEAEMLADAGVPDILLGYNLVGPNLNRAVKFRRKFPDVKLAVTADHPRPIAQLSEAMTAAGTSIAVLLDIDTGQHRTGVEPGDAARGLYGQIVAAPGLEPGGLHVYDGHQHQPSLAERISAVETQWQRVLQLRDDLHAAGWPVPRLVCGGTPTFPVYAPKHDPAIELSPGTCVFWDGGYGRRFPDLQFTPAAVLLTRVISRPTPDRLTLDLGYKAVASDPPAGQRVTFPELPDAEAVLQNEEHLVLQTPQAERFQPGDELWAIPTHICPTTALHKQAYVVSDGRVVDRWDVASRDRWLTI